MAEEAAVVADTDAMRAFARLAIVVLALTCAGCAVASHPNFTPMISGGGNDGGGSGGGSGGM